MRPATQKQNSANVKRHRDNLSGFKGVSFHKQSGLYFARIMVDGIVNSLGYFRLPEQAHNAYVAAAKIKHKAFARSE